MAEEKKKAGRPRKKVQPKIEVEQISEDLEIPTTNMEPVPVKEVNVKTVLNVRKGPGKEFEIVDRKSNGTLVSVFETENGFARIGDEQWVMLQYLK